jgi:NTP pyrophosphatase (non-canonical NTP hydrolase)
MENFEEIQKNVIDWAKDKNIISPDNYPKQMMKVMEELGELSSAILKDNLDLEVDSFGDVIVTLVILAEQRSIDLVRSFDLAYQEIKKRKGKTVNGTFIKN